MFTDSSFSLFYIQSACSKTTQGQLRSLIILVYSRKIRRTAMHQSPVCQTISRFHPKDNSKNVAEQKLLQVYFQIDARIYSKTCSLPLVIHIS